MEILETASLSLTRKMDLAHNVETDSKDPGIFSDNLSLDDRAMTKITPVSSDGDGARLVDMPGAWVEGESS